MSRIFGCAAIGVEVLSAAAWVQGVLNEGLQFFAGPAPLGAPPQSMGSADCFSVADTVLTDW